jgi:Helicase conserved C-terminal domain
MPGLAVLGDPLLHTRAGAAPVDPVEVERTIAAQLAADLPAGDTSRASGTEAWYWAAALRRPDSQPVTDRDELLLALTGQSEGEGEGEEDNPLGLTAHITQALQANDVQLPAAPPPDLAVTLAALAAHSPANIAWRALHRLAHDQPGVTEDGHWSAAAVLASGLRSLFSRLETRLLLDRLYGEETYWRAVLRYCAAGNLQAVLDEYVHHLADAGTVRNDDSLRDLAQAAAGAIALRPSRYRALDPTAPDTPLALTARFALRYGGRRQNQEDARQPEIRRAFNSPFWPFVLATTSVGQEGIDFHWWSHAVMHWNTPANPVDFEQREGRVHRYAGHAIRRNIAFRHGSEILAATAGNPWRTAYQLATAETERYGEFAPYWTYPGPARVERHLAPYPLSVDAARLTELKQNVALYRLTFGQPRQEDMLELLRRSGTASHAVQLEELRLDLSPPRRL